MNTTKIVFIGAGSMSFGLSMFRDIFSTQELAGSTLTLVDLNEEYLERMYQLALRMNAEAGSGLCIEKTMDRLEALPGAGFVVNSVAIDRNRLWKFDFEIPRKYGIRHTLGENGGPGGVLLYPAHHSTHHGYRPRYGALLPGCIFYQFHQPRKPLDPGAGDVQQHPFGGVMPWDFYGPERCRQDYGIAIRAGGCLWCRHEPFPMAVGNSRSLYG